MAPHARGPRAAHACEAAGALAQCCCRVFMLAFSVAPRAPSVALPAAPSVSSASRTSRTTVPSMKPTPALPSLSDVLAARSRYHAHGMRVGRLVCRATWYMAQ